MNKQVCLFCLLAFLVGYFFKDITGMNLVEGASSGCAGAGPGREPAGSQFQFSTGTDMVNKAKKKCCSGKAVGAGVPSLAKCT